MAQNLAWAAAVLAVTTAYIRAFGAAQGLGHDFSGPMAKQHRMFVLTIGCLLAAAEAGLGWKPHALLVALIVIVLGSAVTCCAADQAYGGASGESSLMNLVAGIVQLFTGVQARWTGCEPVQKQRIYFANHTSHFDFLVLWAVLPADMRAKTTAAGAADYWTKGELRKWLASKVFSVVLIERQNVTRKNNPITQLVAVLDEGKSLIIFPEGGRSIDGELQEFKGGIYHLAKSRPEVDLIPTYLDNCNRVCQKVSFACATYLLSHIRRRSQTGTWRTQRGFLDRTRKALKECAYL